MVSLKDNLDDQQSLLGVLSAVSFVGFGLLFWLSRQIRNRIEMLKDVLSPDESSSY